jgi:outer membrane usher protein
VGVRTPVWLALALCAWTAPARAQEPDQRAIFALSVNQVDHGEALAVLRGSDVLIARADLESAGLHDFTATAVAVDGRDLVSLESVRPPVRFVVDQDAIALRIDAPLSMLPSHRLDLGAVTPTAMSRVTRPSAFLNYSPQVTVPAQGPVVESAFFESGLSEGGRLYYSGLYASSLNGVARGLTNVTLDDVPRMRRLTLGDTNVSAGAIGGATVLGGITFARDFSMDPYFVRFPSMRFTSTTDVPAHVDVYINGIRVRSEAIDPGTFTLDNVRGLAGAGTVRYVVRDALGREQSYSTPYYVAPTVFAKGVEDFAVSVGLPRERLGADSFAYAAPVALGYYQRGLTNAVTVGVRGESTTDLVSGGPYVATAVPFGTFSLEGGASVGLDGRSGGAAVLSYQYSSRTFSAGGSLRALTDHYATSSLSPDDDRSLWQASTYTSVPVSHLASIATSFAVDAHRDIATYARVGLLAQVQIARDLVAVGEVALVTATPPLSSVDSFLTLSWSPQASTSVTAGVERTTGQAGANGRFSKSAGYGEDWALAAAVDATGDTTRVSAEHRLQASANLVSTYLDWEGDAGSVTVQPAGAVTWVQGAGVFLSRPIYDSFALVHLPGVSGVRVYLNAQDVGRTDRVGDLVVPSMSSFFGSELRIAPEDVPLSYTLDRDAVLAVPPRRGAAYAEFPAVRVHYYRGRVLVVRDGAESAPAFGDLVVRSGAREIVSPIGDGGTFELEELGAGSHPAEVRHSSGTCRFTLEAKETTETIIDLGVLRCTAP